MIDRLTVQQAALRLGVTPVTLRRRLQRDKDHHLGYKDENDNWVVLLPSEQPPEQTEQPPEQTEQPVTPAAVTEQNNEVTAVLRDYIAHLEQEIAALRQQAEQAEQLAKTQRQQNETLQSQLLDLSNRVVQDSERKTVLLGAAERRQLEASQSARQVTSQAEHVKRSWMARLRGRGSD